MCGITKVCDYLEVQLYFWVYSRFFKVISKIILTCEMLHILMFKIYANPSFLNIVNMFNFIVFFSNRKTKNLKKSFVSFNQKSPKYPFVIKFASIFTSLLKLIYDNWQCSFFWKKCRLCLSSCVFWQVSFFYSYLFLLDMFYFVLQVINVGILY